MKTPAAPESSGPPGAGGPAAESADPGLPWLRTWRGVYLFVLGCFIAWVGLLALFTGMFS